MGGGEKIDIFKKATIKLSGIFDLNELYVHLHNWLVQDYRYDVQETKYEEKQRTVGKQFLISWKATREIDEYSQFILLIDWDLRNMKDVVVERGGEKAKLQQGKLKMIITAQIETDYDGRWKSAHSSNS